MINTNTALPHKHYYPWFNELMGKVITEAGYKTHIKPLLIKSDHQCGLRLFVLRLSQYLLCMNKANKQTPCQLCDACKWMSAGTHPDFIVLNYLSYPLISEQSIGKKISVEELRNSVQQFSKSPTSTLGVVVFISEIDTFKRKESDILLKSIEESKDNIIFILTAHDITKVSKTIKSRVRQIWLRGPTYLERSEYIISRVASNSVLTNFLFDLDNPELSEQSLVELTSIFIKFKKLFLSANIKLLFQFLKDFSQNEYYCLQILRWQLFINTYILMCLNEIPTQPINEVINRDEINTLLVLHKSVDRLWSIQDGLLELIKIINEKQSVISPTKILEHSLLLWDIYAE
ncbi:MAG: hypothetical protein QM538_00905 [Methylacidiphilales bacterium]|nr:hypothetical protein [Candidatus Methylacidiphilales bacterium]